MSPLYDKFKEVVKLVTIQSIGVFWTVCLCIPLIKDTVIKRKDVYTIKDRSSYLARLYTERSDFGHNTLTLDGKTFHYAEVGDASKPLVLFLHGFPQFWYAWRHQLRGLRSMDYHLVAVDMRGAGRSYKPREVHDYQMNLLLADIRGIIQKLSPSGRAACVVGHDWGALIAWQAAAQSWEWDQYQDHSGFIDRLIILNGPHAITFFQNFNERLIDAFHYRNLKSLACNPVSTLSRSWQTIRPCVYQFLASYYTFVFNLPFQIGEHWFLLRDIGVFDLMFKTVSKENVSEEDINIYKATFSSDNHACLTGGMNYYRSNALTGFFNDQKRRGIPQPGFIGIPTLVLWGDKDLYIKKELSLPNLEKLVSNLKIVHFPDAAHFVQEECPDRVNDEMRKFITSQKDLDENMEH